MKKSVLFILISVLLLQSVCCPAAGSPNDYTISGLSMSVSIPDGWTVIPLYDKDMIKQLGLDPGAVEILLSELTNAIQGHEMYLVGLSQTSDLCMLISGQDVDAESEDLFNTYTSTFSDYLETALVENGINLNQRDIYRASGQNFIELLYDAQGTEILQFLTCKAGKTSYISMFSLSEKLPADAETILKGIIDSIQFSTKDAESGIATHPVLPNPADKDKPDPIYSSKKKKDTPDAGADAGSAAPSSPLSDFTINSAGVLTKYLGHDADVIIPDSVKVIDYGAFMSNETIRSVIIPEGVLSIGSSAFSGCVNLHSVFIPSSVLKIGNGAFSDCEKLETVVISDGVLFIEKYAFNHTGIRSIDIPGSVKSLGDYAFWDCANLEEITFHEGLEFIGDSAFASCPLLRQIIFPENIISIGSSAFYDCEGLTDVFFGDGLIDLGDHVFLLCSNLKTVRIPASVVHIGQGCFGMKVEVIIPKGSPAEKWCPIQEMNCIY